MKRKGPRKSEWEEAKRLACLILHVFRCAQIYIKRVTSRQLIQLFRLHCQEAYVTKPLSNMGSFIKKKKKTNKQNKTMKQISCHKITTGNLSSDALERRTPTGSELFFSFNMPWHYQICIAKCLYSYKDDLICPRIKNNIPCPSRPRFGSLFTKPCFVSYSTTLVRNE